MPRNRLLVAAGIVAFVATLLARVPAGFALRAAGAERVQAAGVTGTVWKGSLSGVRAGNLRLGESSWDLSVAGLLLGRLSVSFDTRIGDGAASGLLTATPGGRLSCRGCRYEGPLASLRALFPSLNPLDGRLLLEIESVDLRQRWPTTLVGTATLSGALLLPPASGNAAPAARSTLVARAAADPVAGDGVVAVEIEDQGGPLALRGTLRLSPPGSFELEGRARARPEAPAEIVAALAALGRPGADGATEIGLSGTF